MDKKKITLFMEYQDGSAQSWGYDYPQLPTDDAVAVNMAGDFPALPKGLKRDPIARIVITVDYVGGEKKTGTFNLPDLSGESFAAWVFGHIEALEEGGS